LADEIVLADRAADKVEDGERLALGVQCLAVLPGKHELAQLIVERPDLVPFGNRREAHDVPILVRHHMAREIVLVQPVHDHDDRPGPGVVQPAVKGVVKPVVGRLPLGLRECLLGLQRIVDDDDVGTTPCQHAAERSGEPAALGRRLELGHRLPLRRKAGGKEPPVPGAGDDLEEHIGNLRADSYDIFRSKTAYISELAMRSKSEPSHTFRLLL